MSDALREAEGGGWRAQTPAEADARLRNATDGVLLRYPGISLDGVIEAAIEVGRSRSMVRRS